MVVEVIVWWCGVVVRIKVVVVGRTDIVVVDEIALDELLF